MIRPELHIGWLSGYYHQTYISVNYITIARNWKAKNILKRAFTMSDSTGDPVRSCLITILGL